MLTIINNISPKNGLLTMLAVHKSALIDPEDVLKGLALKPRST